MDKMYFNRIFALLIVYVLIGGCSDVWDEHTSLNDDVRPVSLAEYMQEDSKFSQFEALINETGVADMLSSAKQFTIFAPTNDAMDKVPASLLEDAEDKELFVLHHIAFGRVMKNSKIESDRLKMLSTKTIDFSTDPFSVDEVEIDDWNVTVRNGVVHQLNDPVLPRLNVWEYINQEAPSNSHVDYLKSLTDFVFDPDESEVIGFNEDGEEIYDSVFVYRNAFNMEVADLSSEDSIFTFFIVGDQSLNEEYEKFAPYFKVRDGSTPEDTAYTMKQITMDYVLTEAYSSKEEIPAMPASPFGVKLNYSPAAVVDSYRASNGYVYIVSACPVELGNRIRPVIIQGEHPESYYGNEETETGVAEGYLRKRDLASGGLDFVLDNHVAGSGTALSDGLILPAGILPSITYEVYWRAINDFNTSYRYPNDNVLVQHLFAAIPGPKDASTGRYKSFSTGRHIGDSIAVTATEYMVMPPTGDDLLEEPLEDEVYLGTYNNFSVGEVFLQLLPDGETTRNMAVTADYIRMVPVFN